MSQLLFINLDATTTHVTLNAPVALSRRYITLKQVSFKLKNAWVSDDFHVKSSVFQAPAAYRIDSSESRNGYIVVPTPASAAGTIVRTVDYNVPCVQFIPQTFDISLTTDSGTPVASNDIDNVRLWFNYD